MDHQPPPAGASPEGDPGAHLPAPSTAPGPSRGRRWGERAAFLAGVALLGLLLAVAGQTEPARGGDRVGRRLELVELIARQQQRTAELAAEAAALEDQIAEYEALLADRGPVDDALQEQVDGTAVAAGLTPMAGPGVSVTLRDSSQSLTEAEGAQVNDLVIHEQDLQAVVNALWSGGAEAMSVNGQRLLATSAIRCVGNILLLNGRVHPPPYEIRAIGGHDELRAALELDSAVSAFREAAEQFSLGFDVVDLDEITVPAFEGPPAVNVAVPGEAA